MPKVTIIVPLISSKDNFDKALYSLAHQNFQDFDILIMSNENRQNYYNLNNVNFQKISNKWNISEILNEGLNYTNSELICFFNPNDLLLYNAISLRFNEFEKNKDLIGCYGFGLDTDLNYKIKHNNKHEYFFNETAELPNNNLNSVLNNEINLSISSIMVKKTALANIKFDSNLKMLFSWKFFIELFNKYQDNIVQLKEAIYISKNDEITLKTNNSFKIYLKESIYSLDSYFTTNSSYSTLDEIKYSYYKNLFYTALFILIEHFQENYFLNAFLLFNYLKINNQFKNKFIDILFLYILLNNTIIFNKICKNKRFIRNNFLTILH